MADEDMMLTDDMSQVPAPSDAVAEGTYHVRVSSVEKGMSENQQPVIKLQMKVQQEGPMLGRIVPDTCSLQSHALFKLKGYYKAAGYNPGPEGHNPKKLMDAEFYINVEHSTYQGRPTINIPPWSIRSLQDGPARGKSTAKAS